MNGIPRYEEPDSIRGVYDSEDEADNSFRNMPAFRTKAECMEYKERTRARTNPSSKRPAMTQVVTFFVNWEQVVRYILPQMAKYRRKYPFLPGRETAIAGNSFFEGPLHAALKQRLDLSFHSKLTAESTLNTLRYMLFHMRCGIYVMIRSRKLVMFAPFVNEEYENNWYHILKTEPPSWGEYQRRKNDILARHRKRPEHITMPRQHWWANGNIICNVAGDNLWSDQYVGHLKHMLQETCRHRDVPDCEFFINKRDYPHLKADLSEPYDFLYDAAEPVPLREERYASYAPITSFYVSDEFADLPFVVTDDWDTATGQVFLPLGKDDRSEAKREEHSCPWEEKVNTAFFRGSATGGGVTIATNQRLKLASLSHEWRADPRRGPGNEVDGQPFLDAGVTKFNFRDKKLEGEPMRFIDPAEFPFPTAGYVPMYEQVRFKYIIYAEGHAAASRYASMMKLGSVILKVESTTKARDIWYFPLLKPWEDHVPVKADLSDLAEKIEWCKRHDAECRAIAATAARLFDKFMSKDGIMDYVQLLCHEVGSRFSPELDVHSGARSFSLGGALNSKYAEAGLPYSTKPPAFMPTVKQQQQQCHCDMCTEESISVNDDVTKAQGVLPEIALRVKSAVLRSSAPSRKRARPGRASAGAGAGADGSDAGAAKAAPSATAAESGGSEDAGIDRGRAIEPVQRKPLDPKLLALLSKRRVR